MQKDIVKTAKKILGTVLCLFVISVNLMPQMEVLRNLDDEIALSEAGDLMANLNGNLPISVYDTKGVAVSQDMSQSLSQIDESDQTLVIKLCGITVKQVNAVKRDTLMLMPGGQSIGVKLHTMGALVVGFGDVVTYDGKKERPAHKAGLEVGDIITEIDGQKIAGAEHVIKLCNVSEGKAVKVKVLRDEKTMEFEILPGFDAIENEYKLGLWVRDSTVGIGTLSFYRMDNKAFGALGHAITDIDTGSLLIAEQGEIVLAQVTGIKKGAEGEPGELLGAFSSISRRLGSIEKNSTQGLYGTVYENICCEQYPDGLEAAYHEEIKEGAATILSTVDNNGVKEYSCEIIKVYRQSEREEKDMVLQITDKRLLDKTGGIVQGMSGSPIIQNGKIIGAVTHVLVNDPTRGYGIFIENMLEAAG
ncbi:MAG: SpoIVB peptidase [Clostridia bacterium]|nr:SpoIVB peptidase [Clostridia bacterium]